MACRPIWPTQTGPRGLILAQDKRLQKASDFFDAVGLGLRDTYSTITDLLVGLKSLFTRADQAGKEAISRPVMIATLAYQYASIDLCEFIFFHRHDLDQRIAVINFLPIPVLDGGHMVFLCYETDSRQKPASGTHPRQGSHVCRFALYRLPLYLRAVPGYFASVLPAGVTLFDGAAHAAQRSKRLAGHQPLAPLRLRLRLAFDARPQPPNPPRTTATGIFHALLQRRTNLVSLNEEINRSQAEDRCS